MRKLISVSSLACLFAYFYICIFPFQAEAQTPRPTPVVLQSSQVVNHDYLVAGSSVDIEGKVNGDVYAAGGVVVINGIVNGDVIATGGQLTIKGNVTNVRVVGGQVLIDGTVKGNVSVAGGSVTFGSAAHITGGIVAAGGQINILGSIGKTVYVAGGQVMLENTIGSDVSAAVGSIILTPSAQVNGSVWYMSPSKATFESGSRIKGKVTYVPSPTTKRSSPLALIAGAKIIGGIYSLILGFIVGILLLSLLPVYTKRATLIISKNTWMSLGIGILAWAVAPFLFVIFAITIIGIPFSILLLIAMFLFSYIGRILSTIVIGIWVFDRFGYKAGYVWILLFGLIIYEVISWIPFIGGLFSLVITFIGLGATLILEKQYYTEFRRKKIL